VGKLVRDRIPEIIHANGDIAVVRTLTLAEYREALRDKLREECEEARLAPSEELAGELADVLEVLQAMANIADLTWEEVLQLQVAKRDQRGGFDERVWLE
jgi:predicted house-cleaning noncanonical NTP pyrophosphatase (MazG superfamily)